MRASCGFSLLELLIVLLILGVIAALVVPDLQSTLVAARLDGAARDAIRAIRWAQELAVSTQCPHGVVFDRQANDAQLLRVSEVLPAALAGSIVTEPVSHRPFTIEFSDYPVQISSVANSEGLDWLLFDASGAAQSSLTLVLSSSGRTRTINVSIGTGVATVQ